MSTQTQTFSFAGYRKERSRPDVCCSGTSKHPKHGDVSTAAVMSVCVYVFLFQLQMGVSPICLICILSVFAFSGSKPLFGSFLNQSCVTKLKVSNTTHRTHNLVDQTCAAKSILWIKLCLTFKELFTENIVSKLSHVCVMFTPTVFKSQ